MSLSDLALEGLEEIVRLKEKLWFDDVVQAKLEKISRILLQLAQEGGKHEAVSPLPNSGMPSLRRASAPMPHSQVEAEK